MTEFVFVPKSPLTFEKPGSSFGTIALVIILVLVLTAVLWSTKRSTPNSSADETP